MLSIITSTPIIVIRFVINCVALWSKLWLSVSTSFVTSDNVSPFVFLSKYDIGSLFTFSDISFLNLYVVFCDIPAIINPCIYVKIALIMYRINSPRSIFVIFSKFIPPSPDILFINPFDNSVIVFPSILGPIIENTVEATANSATIIRPIL